jgi:PKD repeat protein
MKSKITSAMKTPLKAGIILAGILASSLSFGQELATVSKWKGDPFDQKVFIENRGQFEEGSNDGNGAVLYSSSQNGISMFWSANSLTYKFSEYYLSPEAKREIKREGPEELKEKMEMRYHYLEMEWLGANTSKVITESPVSFYFTYGDPKDKTGASGLKASAYKKIIYKDIYPGIDAEYILPEKGGVKYSLIVHPGADPSLIQMKYNGAESTFLNSNGEIEISSKHCGTFMEHQPKTFDENGAVVASSFVMNKGAIGFSIPSYDKAKTLIIDPWVSVITFPATTSYVPYSKNGYDVTYDISGNVWVYGGGAPCSLAKYSASGSLLWLFSVPLNSVWLVGDLDVNKNSGTAYVSEGYGQFGARIVKVSPGGMLQATFAGSTKNFEISRLRLNCSGKLYVTGGGVPQGIWQVGSIDTNLTTLTGSHVTTSMNGDHDANLMALDPNGNFMYVNYNYPAPGSLDFLHNNEMHKIPTPGYTPSAWKNPGPIYSFQELSSMPYSGDANSSWASRINIFNGMVCGNGFLYTYNGDTLKQFDKATGAMVKMVKTAGKRYVTGGLDLDLCENVYASVGNKVEVYDANLNFVKTYALPDTSCYDLKVDNNKNLIYATGHGYVCAVTITGSTPPTLNLTATATPANGCSACNGTATANFTINSPCVNAFNYTYSWLPGGQTSPTISNLCPGTYTVIASANLACSKVLGDTAVVVVNGGSGSLQDDFTFTGTCNSMSFADTSKGGITGWYWSFPGGSPATSTVQNPSNILYPPGTYTATLIVSAGSGCTDTITHPFTMGGLPTAAFVSSAPCLGTSISLADGSVSPTGDPIISWSWSMTGGAPSSASTQNAAAVYNTAGTHSVTLVVTTNSGCKDTIIQQVLIYSPPVANLSGDGKGCAPICVSNYLDLSTSADGSITSWSWSFPGGTPSSSAQQNPGTICYNTAGTYGASLIVTSSYGCSDTVNVSPLVTAYPGTHADFCVAPDKAPATNPVFNFCDLWTPNPGVTSWVWNFGDGSPLDSTSTNPVHSYSSTVTGNDFYHYTVSLYVQNQYGCWDTISKIVELIPEFTFYIPNAFTPNGDFTNEDFFGKSRGVKEYNIWLFDRWGNMIWDCHHDGASASLDNNGSDGLSSMCKWNGVVQPGGVDMSGKSKQLAQEDVYVWKVKLTDIFDKDHDYIGHVSVVR